MGKLYTDICSFQEDNLTLQVNLPFSQSTDVLKLPLQIGAKTVPNRLACQPMEGCDGTADGSPDVLTARRYDRLARGGAGLIWFEATAVLKEGRANPRQLFICEDNLADFKRQVDTIKTAGIHCKRQRAYHHHAGNAFRPVQQAGWCPGSADRVQ